MVEKLLGYYMNDVKDIDLSVLLGEEKGDDEEEVWSFWRSLLYAGSIYTTIGKLDNVCDASVCETSEVSHGCGPHGEVKFCACQTFNRDQITRVMHKHLTHEQRKYGFHSYFHTKFHRNIHVEAFGCFIKVWMSYRLLETWLVSGQSSGSISCIREHE